MKFDITIWAFYFQTQGMAISYNTCIFKEGDHYTIYRRYQGKWWYQTQFQKSGTGFARFLEYTYNGGMSTVEYRMKRRRCLECSPCYYTPSVEHEVILNYLKQDPIATDMILDVIRG